MPTDVFANILPAQPAPTLGVAVATAPASGTSESWTVIVPAGLSLPTLGSGVQMRCLIENEIVTVTAGTTTTGTQTWTVTRGSEPGTIATHALGVVLAPVMTAGSEGTFVELSPAAAQTGAINVTGTGTFGGNLAAPNLNDNPLVNAGDLVQGGTPAAGVAPPVALTNPGATDNGYVLGISGGVPAYGVPFLHASRYGYVSMSLDLGYATGQPQLSTGVTTLTKIMVPVAGTINTLYVPVDVIGATLTAGDNWVGIYNSSGSRLWQTGADTAFVTVGWNALTVSVSINPATSPFIWVALLSVGTTMPKFAGSALASALLLNGNAPTTALAHGKITATGQTTLPASFAPSTDISTDTRGFFVGYS